MGVNTICLRYVADVFVLVPEVTDLEEKKKHLNEVENKIQFTLETEENGTLPFLDIVIMKHGNDPKCSVPEGGKKQTVKTRALYWLGSQRDPR